MTTKLTKSLIVTGRSMRGTNKATSGTFAEIALSPTSAYASTPLDGEPSSCATGSRAANG